VKPLSIEDLVRALKTAYLARHPHVATAQPSTVATVAAATVTDSKQG
jgi:hypothetical protein